MKAIQFLIDKTGTLIYPTILPSSDIDGMTNPPTNNQVTIIFYNGISTSPSGVITPINPVTTGLSGTVTLQARTTTDSVWSNIQDGALDISTGANMAFPSGAIDSIQAICAGVAGCNYILIRLDRGS